MIMNLITEKIGEAQKENKQERAVVNVHDQNFG